MNEQTSGSPVRVALNFVSDLEPRFGSRVYIHRLATELSRLGGVELVLLVGKGQASGLPAELRRAAVEVPIKQTRSYWQFLYYPMMARQIRKSLANVYHLPNTLPLLYRSVPTLVTIHDLAELKVRKYNRLRTAYRWLVNYMAAHVANHVITVSEHSKKDIVELLSVPAEKITVIYNGVDAMFRPLDKDQCRRLLESEYGISGEFVLATGGLSGNKNVVGVLSAFAQVVKSGFDVSLVITGVGPSRYVNSLQGKAQELGIGEKVLFTGHVPGEHLPKFYNCCLMLLYPSLYEGFGLPILESMACGAPVVTSDASSLPEVAGGAALLVDPLDVSAIAAAIERLLEDIQLRSDLICKGYHRAATFTWSSAAQKTVLAYQAVLNRSAS